MTIPHRVLRGLKIASKNSKLPIKLSLDPETAKLIPTVGEKKSKVLSEAFLFSDTVTEFVKDLKNLGYAFYALDEKLALDGKLEEYI